LGASAVRPTAAAIFGHDAALAVTESDLDDNLSLVAAIDRHVDLRLTAAATGALATPTHARTDRTEGSALETSSTTTKTPGSHGDAESCPGQRRSTISAADTMISTSTVAPPRSHFIKRSAIGRDHR
jgi:hypothetical protein